MFPCPGLPGQSFCPLPLLGPRAGAVVPVPPRCVLPDRSGNGRAFSCAAVEAGAAGALMPPARRCGAGVPAGAAEAIPADGGAGELLIAESEREAGNIAGLTSIEST